MEQNNDLAFSNPVQEAIFVGAHEEAGLWEVLIDIVDDMHVDRLTAFELLKEEIDYLLERNDIYLIYSETLTGFEKAEMINKNSILSLELDDIEFHEEGPFYFFFSSPLSKS